MDSAKVNKIMQAALAIMAIGVGGVIGAVVMELRTGAAIWELFMKIFPTAIGVGGVLFGYGMTKIKKG